MLPSGCRRQGLFGENPAAASQGLMHGPSRPRPSIKNPSMSLSALLQHSVPGRGSLGAPLKREMAEVRRPPSTPDLPTRLTVQQL